MVKAISTMSIRGGLILLVLLAVLPSLALQIYDGAMLRRHLVADATDEVIQAVDALAQTQERTTQGTRLLLTALAAMPGLRQLDRAACASLFASLLKENPFYTNILVVDAQGDVIASGLPDNPANLSGRKHFRDAMALKHFTAGQYSGSSADGEPVFPFSLPLVNDQGTVVGVLIATVNLHSFDAAFDALHMPAGTNYSITDHAGVRLHHTPPTAANPLGKHIRAEAWQVINTGGDTGVFRQPGSDGVTRQYAFHKLRLSPAAPPYMTVVVGMPAEAILAPARQALRHNLILLAVTTALALVVAWLVGGAVIVRRLDRIADTAARIGQGELTARTGLPSGGSGIAKVAGSLDAMAELLAANDAARERALTALRQSQQRMAHIAASMADWIWEVDANDRYLHLGDKVRVALGYAPADLVGKSFYDFLAPGEEQTVRPSIEAAKAAGKPLRDLINWRMTADGKRRCLMTSGVAWHDETGRFQGYRGVDKDVTERVEAERAIRASLAEKEILLKEIHHRVKNNLQIISSLLYLQSEQVEDPAALESFRISRNRIASMALVHEEIYRSADLSNIRLDTYIRDLLPKIFGQGSKDAPLDIRCILAPVTVPIEQAVPAGLAVNELLTNAHKHAFVGRENPALSVTLTDARETIVITIADNGPGLPDGFDVEQTGTLGMQLVLNLARQLGGSIEAHNNHGAVFSLRFPKANPPQAARS